MSSKLVKAHSYLTTDGLSITRLSGRPRTPGNVGLTLSGGGSRSAAASLGAVRALARFDLLQHIRALSCVSGGSWFGVPFCFLPKDHDEHAFLGHYVDDHSTLRLEQGEDPTDLRSLPAGNYGEVLTRFDISTANIVAEAALARYRGVARSRLWCRQVGEQLLAHFGLARFDDALPADTFAADEPMARSMAMSAPGLPTPYLLRISPSLPRPALIVGGAMVVQGGDGRDRLAPVQFTPWFSGVMGTDIGTLGGKPVGGGGISSYAFGGQWLAGPRERPQVEVHCPLSLSDITGISSAAYADGLNDRGITELSPSLIYFSPYWSRPAGVHARFADGGSLENTGIANMLAYEDIDSIIAIINAPTCVEPIDGVPDDVNLPMQVSALFGYQQYDERLGHVRFGQLGPGPADYAHNQVFSDAHGEFAQLREQLAHKLDRREPCVVLQELEVVDNPYFAVKGGRRIRVLWSILGRCDRWEQLLDRDIRLLLDRSFPNLPTLRTSLPTATVSLLAHYAGWMLGVHRREVQSLFFG